MIDLTNLTDSDNTSWEDFTFDSDRETYKLKFNRGESVTGKIQKMKNSTIIISRKRRQQQHTRSKTQEIDFEIGIILIEPPYMKQEFKNFKNSIPKMTHHAGSRWEWDEI